MKTEKHTAGPWLAILSAGPSNWMVANAGDRPGMGMPIARIENYGGNEEANARLMAASPALLAACKKVVRDLEYSFGGHGQMPHSEQGIYTELTAAIALAEGRGE